jgi:Secretin and TonB N terminus short domain/TonB-dependent Receptor Plug Domain
MRINLITLFAAMAFLMVHSKSYSQITIHEKNVQIQTIFKSIEQQSKLTFLYDSKDIQELSKVTVNVENGSIQDALNQALKGSLLTYKIIAQTILIKKEPQKIINGGQKVSLQKKAALQIKGKVVDENLLPIKNVFIKEPKLGTETRSGANGEFMIEGGSSGFITLEASGFSKKSISYTDTAYLDITLQSSGPQAIDLDEVKIQSLDTKKNPTRFVNLDNRSYMNLSQVLQGTVPGLSLQVVNTSTKTVTSVDAYVYRLNGQTVGTFVRFSVEDFLNREGKVQGQNIIDMLLKGTNVPQTIRDRYHINTITTVTNAIVPEIRGANNFGSNTSTMLVVIDGFPQDGFPANYPMTNVESIEVVKDPKELIKWGARASGGAILIRSKSAKAGKLEINYSGNFYYSPAPKFDRSQLQLSNSATYLEYLNDPALNLNFSTTPFGLSPVKQLLSQKKQKLITDEQFNSKWDSLSRLDNESQLGLLQQDSYSQNHALTISGGTKAYRFTAIGNYIGGQGNDLGGKNNQYTFSLNNNFALLKDKLHIRWLINYTDSKVKSGYSFSPTNVGLDPYQMLLDRQGNYIYDYTRLSASANQQIMDRGYKNFGVNLLEDARVNDVTNRTISKQSNLNMNWDLLPGLKWATSFIYNSRSSNSRNFYDAQSSYVRQLVDTYGQIGTNGVNFYVPYGNILKESSRVYSDVNLRTALSYAKVIGKHSIAVGIGAGGASTTSSSPPGATLYGYNQNTRTSTPVYLPTNPSVDAAITNFYTLFAGASSSAYPYSLTQSLTGDTSKVRNLNANASLDYGFADRVKLSGLYTTVLNPLYGQSATYSKQYSYKTDLTGRVVKDWNRFLKDVLVSVGTDGVQMPDLPVRYSNSRYRQLFFNNYTIWVNGATPTQQQGQSSKLYYQKLTLAFADSAVVVNGSYNIQKIRGSLITENANNAATNQLTTSRYLSAGFDLFLRKKLLNLRLNYGKSPEGQSQFNGSFNYNVAQESYFKSNTITSLELSAILQEISPYQGLSLMTSTNIATNGSFSQAINSDFGLLPSANKLIEAHAKIGLKDDKYSMDLRYYDLTSNGLSNGIAVLTDPSTGLSNQVSYSSINNKGLEFFFNTAVIKNHSFSYNVTLNGAHNTNTAKNVPLTRFTATRDYTTALRDGYDISNIWAPQWAGLNSNGDPQIYDKNGNITAVLDSATVASSLVKQGVTKAPWTGGLIQEFRLRQFFARVALTFNLGYVMRNYLPYPGDDTENSSLVAERWRNPGDEAFTDVPRINGAGGNSYREFVTRYSSNSILPADNIRLQEVMIGFNIPNSYLKKYKISYAVVTFQVQNVTYWAKNKYNIDPATISIDGRIGTSLPRIYSCNLSVNF